MKEVIREIDQAAAAEHRALGLSGPLRHSIALARRSVRRVGRGGHGDATFAAAGAAIERHERQIAVRRDFDGRNHGELAKRYGISERQVRRLLHPEREQ